MRRSVARILAFITAGLVALLIAAVAMLWYAFEPSKDEVASVKSPDGRLVAKLFEINGGATTSFRYLVTVSDAAAPSREHEAASLQGAVRGPSAWGANLRWNSPRELTVEYLDAKSTDLLNPKISLLGSEITVLLRPNITDSSAPPGGMLYNLRGRPK